MSNKKKRIYDMMERYDFKVIPEPSIKDYIRGIQKDELWEECSLGYADALMCAAENKAFSHTKVFIMTNDASDHTPEELLNMARSQQEETPRKYRLDLSKCFDGEDCLVLTEVILNDERTNERYTDSFLMISAGYIPYPHACILRVDQLLIGTFEQFEEEVKQWLTHTLEITLTEFKDTWDYGHTLCSKC